MYPLDRRVLSTHVYTLLNSLRKTALVLQVSHSTVSRWLKNPERKQYSSRAKVPKSQQITHTLKAAVEANPFISLHSLKKLIKEVHSLDVSKELLRIAIRKQGFSKKKAKFFSESKDKQEKTRDFIDTRDLLKRQGVKFVSLDETSFGRSFQESRGYSPIGKPLFVKRRKSRVTTLSSVVAVDEERILHRTETPGSFNTRKFIDFMESIPIPQGSVILLDNVSFHHAKDVKTLAMNKGWKLLYVPPYSPWYNPIEGVFSIVKREYYKHGCINQAFDVVSQGHLKAFFDKSLELKLI